MAVKAVIVNTERLLLSAGESFVRFDVGQYTKVSVSVRYQKDAYGTWDSAVITVEKSLDGQVWGSTSTTLTGESMTADIDVSTAQFLRARVSTAESDAGHVIVTLGALVSDQ